MRVGGTEQLLTSSCLPQAASGAGAKPGHHTLMGKAFFPTSSFLGNLDKSLSFSVLPPDHSPHTWRIFNQPLPCFSSLNQKSTSQKRSSSH